MPGGVVAKWSMYVQQFWISVWDNPNWETSPAYQNLAADYRSLMDTYEDPFMKKLFEFEAIPGTRIGNTLNGVRIFDDANDNEGFKKLSITLEGVEQGRIVVVLTPIKTAADKPTQFDGVMPLSEWFSDQTDCPDIPAGFEIDEKSKTLSVRGNTSSGPGKRVALWIENEKGDLVYAGQTVTGSDGEYKFTAKLGTFGLMPYGAYKISVNGDFRRGKPIMLPFVYREAGNKRE